MEKTNWDKDFNTLMSRHKKQTDSLAHAGVSVESVAKISSLFPKYLFWDMDMDRLDVQKDKDIIIPRALFMSNADSFDDDIERLESFYSTADIVSNLKATKERISNKVCELVVNRYHIPAFYRFSHH